MSNATLVKKLEPRKKEDSYAWATVKTVLMGDFYDDPTWLGIGIRAGLGCVPVLGQILDLADTAAWVLLAYERGIDDPEVMLNGAILFIGYVPGVGDLMRSVLKGLVSNRAVRGIAHLLELVLNTVSLNQYKALKKVVYEGWDDCVGKSITVAHDFLDSFKKHLDELKGYMPKRLVDDVEQLSKFVTNLRANVEQGFRDALQGPREQLEKLFAAFEETRFPVGPKGTAKRVDGVTPPNKTDGILVPEPEPVMVRQGDEIVDGVEKIELRNRGTIPNEQWRDGLEKLEKPGEHFFLADQKGGKEGLVDALNGQDVEYAIRRRADTGDWYVIRGDANSCPTLDKADALVYHNHPTAGPKPSLDDGDRGAIEASRKARGKKGKRSALIGTEEGTHRWTFKHGDPDKDMHIIGGDSPDARAAQAQRSAAIEEYGYVPGEELDVVGYERFGNDPVYEGGVQWDGTPADDWRDMNGKLHFPDEEEVVLPPKRCPAPAKSPKVTPSEVEAAVEGLEKRGLKFGQNHLYMEGAHGRKGVQDYVDYINDPNSGPANLPWIDENNVIADGHHMAVAMEVTDSWDDELIAKAKKETARAKAEGQMDHWKYDKNGISRDRVSINSKEGKVVAGAGSMSLAGKAFQEKFGREGAIAYRGVRVRKGGKIPDDWEQGKLVFVESDLMADPMDTALHHAKQRLKGTTEAILDDDEIIVMSFRVHGLDIAEDRYGTLDHLFLRTGIDPTESPTLWEFKETRFSLEPPDTKGVPIDDPDYRMPTTRAEPGAPQKTDRVREPDATGEPVNVVNGEVFAEETDFALPGPIPLTFTRQWTSTHATRLSPLGRGWMHSLDQSLHIERDQVVLRTAARSLFFAPLDLIGQFDYHRGGRVTLTRRKKGYTVTDSDNKTYVFADVNRFDDALALTGIVDRNGNRIDLKYDDKGLLVEVIDSAGRQLRFVNNDDGFLTAVEAPDPDGSNGQKRRLVSYDYDDEPHLVAVRDALDKPFTYRYDQEHLIVRHTDRNGVSFYWEYDTAFLWPRCTRTWGDGNILYRELSYDRPNRITTVKDGAGHTWVYHGNTIGMVEREIDPLGNVTLRDYDRDGNLLSEQNPNGETTRYEYDDDGRQIAEIDALGNRSEVRYDRDGRVAETIDAAGHSWRYDYDDAGNVASVTNPLGGVWRYKYNERGLPLQVTDPAGNSMSFEWDAAGCPVSTTDRAGARSRMTYDGWGRLISREDALGSTTRWSWDLTGRLGSQIDAAGRRSTFKYDGEGNQIEAEGPLGQKLRYVFGPLGVPQRILRPDGRVTHLKYNSELQLIVVKDARDKRWMFERDPLGQVTKETTFDGRCRQYSFDPAGRVVLEQSARGHATKMAYDATGRLTERELADGRKERFEYDRNGRMCLAENDAGCLQLRYDALGNVLEETFNDETIKTGYDACGNRIRRQSPLNNDLRFDFDGEQQLAAVYHGQEPLLFVDRDAIGAEVERRLVGGLRMTREYLATGELTASRTYREATELSARDYRYDAGGRLTSVKDSVFGAVGFKHDLSGRLEQAIYPDRTVQQFLNDEAGNVSGTPTASSEKARRSESNGWRLRWDEDGNLLEKIGHEVHYTFEYDFAGRLNRVTRDVRVSASKHTKRRRIDPAQRQVFGFTYDALGRRVTKQRESARGDVEHTVFFWDGDVPLGQRKNGANEGVEFVFAESGFAPLAQIGEGYDCVIECDNIDTPRAAYSAEGEVIWQADYTAYGVLKEERGQQGLVPFRFQGQYADGEIGLSYNRYRYYDPDLRLYTSADPLGILAGENDHNYVDDPLSCVDPYGLACNQTTPIKTRSRVEESSWAIKQEKKMSEQSRKDADKLIERFEAGDRSPGLGTRPLGGGFYELRGKNNGRVIVKQTGKDSFDIVGKFQGHAKAKKGNSKIIQGFIDGYPD